MKLTETKFDNFRCFKHYELKYGIETTVFIGKNGTGKSSVLSGIRRGLSFMFAKSKNHQKNLSISNNAKVKSFGKFEANFDSYSRNFNYPINNTFKAIYNNTDIEWAMVKNNMNGGLLTTQYSEALNIALGFYNQDTENSLSLPVLAVITDSFPHQLINFGSKAKKIVYQDILPRDLGYYGWDDRTNCLELWLNRFYKVFSFERDIQHDIEKFEEQIFLFEKLIDNKDKYDYDKVPEWKERIKKLKSNLYHLQNDTRRKDFLKEKDYIQNKLIKFTEPLSKTYNFINDEFELFRISINRLNKEDFSLEFTFKDSRSITFDTLPMGYKRMFSMVIDIAYRSYILNQGIESNGVVLIDEIELHLHPTLQQEILQRLRITFPNIQFIVTTHSPLVISNFKTDSNNKIIKLEHDRNDYYNEEVDNIYGIDYNTGLTEVMGARYRQSELEKLIDSIVILTKFGKLEQASQIKTELIDIAGRNNKYLESEINKRLKQNNKA
ncbi:AAA family ATPase [Chryseobacterium candidae]|uniref:Endonuclease GajA/Old nuclease/RecF-like AAA domain-containing protein n=1 Tax=Chryseobacterium candidae TaxID=1978493 RepID=A0ABY2R5T8_9FLAO|nr:AAA family ATPase [Chryseobacterium candidae]THV58501.1 hypothetical protein EK417_12835 [Chryseobacterium candidae]